MSGSIFKKIYYLLAVITVILLCFVACTAWTAERKIHVIDFTGQADGSAVTWLEQHGFEFELNAKSLNPRFKNDALVISAETETAGLFGLRLAQQDFIRGVKRIEIVWGVNQYPEGADWDNGINSVPIAVMLSFGTERLSSGGPLGIKAAPYFLSPFIGKRENPDKMYIGKLWREGGRYFCVESGDQSGKTIVTDFEVDERFKTVFKQDETPPITAIAFQKNTNNTLGTSEAFIKKITFLSE